MVQAQEQETSVELVDLTDEELAAIDNRPPDSRLVVYPFLDRLDEHDQQTAIAVAFRSLAARGLVVGPEPAEVERVVQERSSTATVTIDMNEALRRMLELRLGAPRAVIAQRTANESQDFYYLYLLDDEAVLEEFIEPQGLHRFKLLDAAVAADALCNYVNPGALPGRDGEPELFDAVTAASGGAPPAVLEKLGEATSFSEFFVRHLDKQEHPPLTGIFAGPRGLYAMTAEYASEQPVPVRPVSAGTLRAQIQAVIE